MLAWWAGAHSNRGLHGPDSSRLLPLLRCRKRPSSSKTLLSNKEQVDQGTPRSKAA